MNVLSEEDRHRRDPMSGQVWTLTFPAPAKMVSANGGKHWSVGSSAKHTFREVTLVHLRQIHPPKGLDRVRVDIEMRFPTDSGQEEPNYQNYVGKPIVDALARERTYRNPKTGAWVHESGYGLIDDDNPKRHLHCRSCPHLLVSDQRGPRPYGEVVITITDLTGVSDAA